jgi:N-acetylglutamate synthase
MNWGALRATVTPSIQFGRGVEMDNGRTLALFHPEQVAPYIDVEGPNGLVRGQIAMPTVRYLTSDDYDAIIRLWKQAGLQSVRLRGRDSRDAFSAQLAAGQRVIGLEDGGQLVGAILVTHDTRKGWINRLAVHPDHRRKGYATQLIVAAEQELRAMGVRIFAVLVEADNIASQELFAREGYKTNDAVYMSKRDSDDV